MLLGNLLEDDLSDSEVTRRLGVSRDAGHRLIRTGPLDEEPVRYGPRAS